MENKESLEAKVHQDPIVMHKFRGEHVIADNTESSVASSDANAVFYGAWVLRERSISWLSKVHLRMDQSHPLTSPKSLPAKRVHTLKKKLKMT